MRRNFLYLIISFLCLTLFSQFSFAVNDETTPQVPRSDLGTAKDFAKNVTKLLDQQIDLYLKGKLLTKAYDAEIEKALANGEEFSAPDSKAYNELLMYRNVRDNLENKIVAGHQLLKKLSKKIETIRKAKTNTKGALSQGIEKFENAAYELVTNAKKSFEDRINNANDIEKMALISLVEKIQEASKQASLQASSQNIEDNKEGISILQSVKDLFSKRKSIKGIQANSESIESKEKSLESEEDSVASTEVAEDSFPEFDQLLDTQDDSRLIELAQSTEKELVEIAEKNEKKIDSNINDLVKEAKTLDRVELLEKAFGESDKTNLRNVIGTPGGKAVNITGATFPLGTWALTFDDGPHNSRTMEIVDTLDRYDLNGTFFTPATNAEKNQTIVKTVAKKGHIVACHSLTHANLGKATGATIRKEIIEATNRLEKVTGERPAFFRLPYGSGLKSSAVHAALIEAKLIHIMWNVDSLDWDDRNPQSVYNRVVKQMKAVKKGVILFHDIHPQTVSAMKMLAEYLANNPSEKVLPLEEILKK